jgi:hypothetical protein
MEMSEKMTLRDPDRDTGAHRQKSGKTGKTGAFRPMGSFHPKRHSFGKNHPE